MSIWIERRKKMITDYKIYPKNTRVRIKSTGETGEAFERALGCISVFIDGEDKCRYFYMNDIEFIEQEDEGEPGAWSGGFADNH